MTTDEGCVSVEEVVKEMEDSDRVTTALLASRNQPDQEVRTGYLK